MTTILTKIRTVLFVLTIPALAHTQSFWEGQVTMGYTNYLGDMVAPMFTLKESHPAGAISIGKYFDARHAIRMNLVHGKVSGSDHNFENLAERAVSFEARLTELSFVGEMDIRGYQRFSGKEGFRKLISPYFFIALGVVYADADFVYENPENEDAGVDFPAFQVVAPIGGGLKFDINQQFMVGIQVSARLMASDYLDGVQRSGNAYKNDIYFFNGLTAGYRFGVKKGKI